MQTVDLETGYQKDLNNSSLEKPILIFKSAVSNCISPSKENSLMFGQLMISNLMGLNSALQHERNDKSIFLIREELENITSFLGDKHWRSRKPESLEIIAAKKLKHLFKEFKLRQSIEVAISFGDNIEDGWYAFRDDTDNMEGFYSTCISGSVNLVNKDGKTRRIGLKKITVK